MAEFGAPRTLTTSGGTILFNTRAASEYFITKTTGEDGTGIRAPMDNKAGEDGGWAFPFKREPRHITVEGILTLDPALTPWQQIQQRNQMEAALLLALAAVFDVGTGTWGYEPTGMPAKSLSIQCDFDANFPGDMKEFVFGMVAADPVWA